MNALNLRKHPKTVRAIVLVVLTGGLVVGFQNCNGAKFTMVGPTDGASNVSTTSTTPPGNAVVCDPLGNGSTLNSKQGLTGSLSYVPTAVSAQAGGYSNLSEMFPSLVTAPVTIVM